MKEKQVVVKTIMGNADQYEDVVVRKSDKSEQLNPAVSESASDWIPKDYNMHGLETLVEHSTILPQCIRAYKNNIAGFGVSVQYRDDIEETAESSAEWDTLERLLELLNLDN